MLVPWTTLLRPMGPFVSESHDGCGPRNRLGVVMAFFLLERGAQSRDHSCRPVNGFRPYRTQLLPRCRRFPTAATLRSSPVNDLTDTKTAGSPAENTTPCWGTFAGGRQFRRRLDHCRRQRDQRCCHSATPPLLPVGRAWRRHRHRVDRPLHRRRPRRRRTSPPVAKKVHHLGAGEGRGRHFRPRC